MSASFFRTVLNWSRTALLPVWTVKRVPVFQVLPSRSQASRSQTHTWTDTHYDTLLLLLDLKGKSLLKHLISTPTEAYDDPMMRHALPRWTKKRNRRTQTRAHTHTPSAHNVATPCQPTPQSVSDGTLSWVQRHGEKTDLKRQRRSENRGTQYENNNGGAITWWKSFHKYII